MFKARLAQLRECDELATPLSGLINPVNRASDGFLEVEPTRLSIHCRSLVFLEDRSHVEDISRLLGLLAR